MSFAHPLVLIAAVFVPAAFAFVYRRLERRRDTQALAYSNLAFALVALRSPRWPAGLLFSAYVAGAGALVAALAGPHFSTRVPLKDGIVILCIDTSGSMRARDVAPTRAAAASAAARAFVDAVPAGTRVGVVSFSTGAALVTAPTSDLETVRGAIDRIPPPGGATAMGDALALAAQQMPAAGHRAIVLMTDGVNNRGDDPLETSQTIGSRGITIDTVGVGTSGSGEVIPGTAELAELDGEALRAIAENGHGRYVEARDASALRSAFAGIALSTVWEKKRIDGSLPVALAGGLLLLLSVGWGIAAGRVP